MAQSYCKQIKFGVYMHWFFNKLAYTVIWISVFLIVCINTFICMKFDVFELVEALFAKNS